MDLMMETTVDDDDDPNTVVEEDETRAGRVARVSDINESERIDTFEQPWMPFHVVTNYYNLATRQNIALGWFNLPSGVDPNQVRTSISECRTFLEIRFPWPKCYVDVERLHKFVAAGVKSGSITGVHLETMLQAKGAISLVMEQVQKDEFADVYSKGCIQLPFEVEASTKEIKGLKDKDTGALTVYFMARQKTSSFKIEQGIEVEEY